MPKENNAENLRLWFRKCPVLSKKNRFGVDYLSENPTQYSIFAVPSTLAYHENILGERTLDLIQSENFIFASKEHYSEDIKQNIENLGFYQDVLMWVIKQNEDGNFPKWDGGTIRSIVPTITGAPVSMGSSVAKYQIQIKITYRRN